MNSVCLSKLWVFTYAHTGSLFQFFIRTTPIALQHSNSGSILHSFFKIKATPALSTHKIQIPVVYFLNKNQPFLPACNIQIIVLVIYYTNLLKIKITPVLSSINMEDSGRFHYFYKNHRFALQHTNNGSILHFL